MFGFFRHAQRRFVTSLYDTGRYIAVWAEPSIGAHVFGSEEKAKEAMVVFFEIFIDVCEKGDEEKRKYIEESLSDCGCEATGSTF